MYLGSFLSALTSGGLEEDGAGGLEDGVDAGLGVCGLL
jgi:hypothetical protein